MAESNIIEDRKRPVCKWPGCGVQTNGQKYCDAHQWRIVKWIGESLERLEIARSKKAA